MDCWEGLLLEWRQFEETKKGEVPMNLALEIKLDRSVRPPFYIPKSFGFSEMR